MLVKRTPTRKRVQTRPARPVMHTPGVYKALTTVGGAKRAQKVTSYMESIVTVEHGDARNKNNFSIEHTEVYITCVVTLNSVGYKLSQNL